MVMKTRYTVQCPDCGDKYSFVLERGEAWPNFCAHCGSFVGTDDSFVPSQMNIGTVKGKAADKTFREYSDATIAQAEAMGDPNIKVTNMKDNLREGDVAAVAPQPSKEYQQIVAGMGDYNPWHASIGGISTADALQLTKNGRERGTGAVAIGAIQESSMPVPIATAGIKPMWGGGQG